MGVTDPIQTHPVLFHSIDAAALLRQSSLPPYTRLEQQDRQV